MSSSVTEGVDCSSESRPCAISPSARELLQAIEEIDSLPTSSCEDILEFSRRTSEIAARALACDSIAVTLNAEDEGALPSVNIYDRLRGEHVPGTPFVEPHYWAELARTRSRYVTSRAVGSEGASISEPYRRRGTRWVLAVRLGRSDAGQGVLCLERTLSRPWQVHEISFALHIADKLDLVLNKNKQNELRERLRSSEQQFQFVLDQAPDAILVYNCDEDRFVGANRSAELLFECNRDDLLRRGPRDFYGPTQPDGKLVTETFADHNRRARLGESLTFERHIRTASGKQIVCEVRLGRLPSSGAPLLRSSFLDITERKKAHEQLLFANTLLQSEIESAPDGVLVIQHQPLVASFNRKFLQMWNLPPGFANPEDPDEILESILGKVKDPVGYRDDILRFRSNPGVSVHREVELEDGRTFEWHAGGMRSHPDSYLGRISFFRDITDRKRSEKELQLANTLLTALLENSPDGTLVVGSTGRILSLNTRFLEQWHIPPAAAETRMEQQLLSVALTRLEDPAAFLAKVEHLYANPDLRSEDEIKTLDGLTFERHSVPLRTRSGEYLGRAWFFRDITAKKQSEHLLREEKMFTEALLGNLPGVFLLIDEAKRYVRWNANLRRLTGLEDSDLAGYDALQFVEEDDRATVREQIQRAFADGHAEMDCKVRALSPSPRVLHCAAETITLGGHQYLLVLGTDVTEARNSALQLRISEERFRSIFNSVNDGICVYDSRTGLLMNVNDRACDMFGYTPAELLGSEFGRLLADSVNSGSLTLGWAPGAQTFEWKCRAKDDSHFWAEISTREAVFGPDKVILATIRDISERKTSQQEITRLARYDGLTSLPNRTVFLETVGHAIARSLRNGSQFAVLYLDLDHFKDVNDTLGHPIGDQLLQAVAKRLSACLRQTDTVARIGGDEFAIIALDIDDLSDVASVAEKLLAAVGDPFMIDGNHIRTGTSIGIALYGPDSPDSEALLSHADIALYRAKSEGRGIYRFFTEAMNEAVRTRVNLSAELRTALVSNELFLVYQPQVDISDGRIVGVEALVRWRHPQRGVITPEEFIHVAEQNGLVVNIDRWVLGAACAQAKKWLDEGIRVPVMAVNISVAHFKSTRQAEDDILGILAESKLPPSVLELELTESVLMEASQEYHAALSALRRVGIRIAIDDFGTGYSSLDYLRRFSVERLKIAQTFITGIESSPGNQAIVKAALGLARELEIEAVVEGVENSTQLELLKKWGCRKIQGYYVSKPLTGQEAADVMRCGRLPAR